MLKKIVGSAASAALLLTLFLAACSMPSDIKFTQTETIPSIDGPSDVRAVVYDGGIQVSWDPSKDAKSYAVYRRTYQDTTTPEGVEEKVFEDKLLTSSTGSNLFWDDIVSYDNQLRNDWEYEYTIVALSGQSTNRSIGTGDIILNATAKSPRVKAKITKARGSQLDPPTVKVDSYTGMNYNNEANLVISWEKVFGATYEVGYSYKTPDGAFLQYSYAGDARTNTTTSAVDLYGYHRVAPTLGPYVFDKVEVRAKFATDYFMPSNLETAKADIQLPGDLRLSYNGIIGLNAATKKPYDSIPNYTGGEQGIYMELSWNDLPDVAPTDPYVLWKAQTNGIGTSSDYGIVGSWTKVSFTGLEHYIDGTTKTAKILVKDTGVEVGKIYTYLLVVTGDKGGKKIQQTNATLVDYLDSAKQKDWFRNQVAASNLQFAVDVEATGIQVSWTPMDAMSGGIDYGVTYNVYKAAITLDDPNGGDSKDNIKEVPTWQIVKTGVDPKDFANNFGSYLKVIDKNGLTPGQYYAYKVEASKSIGGETVSAQPVIKIAKNASPFSNTSELVVNAYGQSRSPYPGIENYAFYPEHSIAVRITTNASTSHINGGTTKVVLYRQDGPTEEFKMIKDGITGDDIKNGTTTVTLYNQNGYEFVDVGDDLTPKGLKAGVSYVYKALVVSNGNALVNTTNNISTGVQRTSDVNYGGITFITIGNGGTNPVQPTKSLKFSAEDAIGANLVGATISFRLDSGTYPTIDTAVTPNRIRYATGTFVRDQDADGKYTNSVSFIAGIPDAGGTMGGYADSTGQTVIIDMYYVGSPVPANGDLSAFPISGTSSAIIGKNSGW